LGWFVRMRFDCPSVAASRGEGLSAHEGEVGSLAQTLGASGAVRQRSICIQRGVEGTEAEIGSVVEGLDRLLGGFGSDGRRLEVGLRCGAFVCSMLAKSRLEKVRGGRLAELVGILCGAAEDEVLAREVGEAS